MRKLQNDKKGKFYTHKQSPLVYYNDNVYVGDADQFNEFVLTEFRYIDKTNMVIYQKKATDAMRQLIENTPGREYVWLDVNVNGAI